MFMKGPKFSSKAPCHHVHDRTKFRALGYPTTTWTPVATVHKLVILEHHIRMAKGAGAKHSTKGSSCGSGAASQGDLQEQGPDDEDAAAYCCWGIIRQVFQSPWIAVKFWGSCSLPNHWIPCQICSKNSRLVMISYNSKSHNIITKLQICITFLQPLNLWPLGSNSRRRRRRQ